MHMQRCYILLFLILVKSCTVQEYTWQTIEVTATAYNSLAYQTQGDPSITAFGDTLVPGRKYIAVSRDLLGLGMEHNTPVKIEGFEDIYFVKDKMHRRWKNKIDIYMGTDVKEAKAWGRRKVRITYGLKIKKTK